MINYLGVNRTDIVQNLYPPNYKTSLKKVKVNSIKEVKIYQINGGINH